MEPILLSPLLGLVGGLILGLAARLGQFCTLGAIESWYLGGNQTRARLWGIILGVAISIIYIAQSMGYVDVTETIYHTVKWNPLASIIGGLMFGYGMALAGNCGFGALARFGGGDLRSFVVVLIIGIVAFMTLSGPLAFIRVALFPAETSESAQGFAYLFGTDPLIPALIIAALFVLWALLYKPLRNDPVVLFWSVAVGIAVAGAFISTYALKEASFDAVSVVGHTYTVPVGASIRYLMTASAGLPEFGVGSVFGLLLGAFIGSLIKGRFRWEACEDPRELGRQVLGAALMGMGGVIALGCSMGQGISGFSTLSYSAPVTLGFIIIGALIGLRQLVQGVTR